MTATVTRRLEVLGEEMVLSYGVAPLLSARPMTRLSDIAFLGILERGEDSSRHSRLTHSLGVAFLAGLVGERSRFPRDLVTHLIVAGLLHDASQWALSHTCEGVFRRITGFGNGQLTRGMIFDDPALPEQYHLASLLDRLDIHRDHLWALLSKDTDAFSESHWRAAVELLSCALNPDTLDGISRAAEIYAVPHPDAREIAESFVYENGQLRLPASAIEQVDAFWSAKATVYGSFIHAPNAMRAELDAARAAHAAFQGTTLSEALELTDEDVLAAIADGPCAEVRAPSAEELRFRPPRVYTIDPQVTWEDSVPVGELARRYRSVVRE